MIAMITAVVPTFRGDEWGIGFFLLSMFFFFFSLSLPVGCSLNFDKKES